MIRKNHDFSWRFVNQWYGSADPDPSQIRNTGRNLFDQLSIENRPHVIVLISEALSKFLDVAGNKLDYRRYGEALLEILIAGGLLGESFSKTVNTVSVEKISLAV